MATAILAEDEPVLRAELQDALSALWPELTIVAQVPDGVSTLRAVERWTPDVVFLDIDLPQLSGLDVARVVQGKTAVVFLTAHSQHALDAFDAGAIDYLVKPLNRGRLVQTIARLQAFLGNATRPAPVLPARPRYLRWIQASVGNLLRLITTDEIYFFQADAKYTCVVTAHTEALIRKPIRELMDELNPDDFLQVNRGAIVNLRRVESIYRADGHMEVRLRERDERLMVSVGYQAAFRQL